uniref:Glutathione S-transferase n=1 Tax=Heterorhabditis bacteriophora TaxID=37862 RepID=A0A1I7X8C4_HETBA
MSPAVTPWFSSLEGAGANNPSFRVYDRGSLGKNAAEASQSI